MMRSGYRCLPLERLARTVGGVDGLWTDNGDTSISYNAGNVYIDADGVTKAVTPHSKYIRAQVASLYWPRTAAGQEYRGF